MRLSLEQLERTPAPSELYHYTSAAGLHGILSQKSVWATIVHFLNDSQEFQHAISIARRMLRDGYRANNPQVCDALSRSLDQIKGVNVSAFSLTQNGDLLSQWRGYCPPGGGYSLGFITARMRPHLQRQGFLLAPCVYAFAQQQELLAPILEKAIREYREADTEEKRQVVLSMFFLEFSRIAPLLKDSAFSEEQEWRAVSQMIHFNHPQMRTRPGRTMLIPYFLLNLGNDPNDLPFGQIIVGPNPHQELAMKAISFLRSCCNVPGATGRSFIPYREF